MAAREWCTASGKGPPPDPDGRAGWVAMAMKRKWRGVYRKGPKRDSILIDSRASPSATLPAPADPACRERTTGPVLRCLGEPSHRRPISSGASVLEGRGGRTQRGDGGRMDPPSGRARPRHGPSPDRDPVPRGPGGATRTPPWRPPAHTPATPPTGSSTPGSPTPIRGAPAGAPSATSLSGASGKDSN